MNNKCKEYQFFFHGDKSSVVFEYVSLIFIDYNVNWYDLFIVIVIVFISQFHPWCENNRHNFDARAIWNVNDALIVWCSDIMQCSVEMIVMITAKLLCLT